MELITRPSYLKKIKSLIDTEFIKVITGVRRSGKSYLLLMLKNELLKRGIDQKQIIYLNFENPEYFDLLSYKKLYSYLKDKVKTDQKVYFL